MTGLDLGIDDDELASCVACGLCLPHCPTYRVTGEEALSPRGRIAAMRQVQWAGTPPDDAFVRSMETCVQCRGCETACPSGVPFGHLIEATNRVLAEPPRKLPALTGTGEGRRGQKALERLGLRALGHHPLLLAGAWLLGRGQRLHPVPPRLSRRLGLPDRLPLRQPPLRASGSDVWLFTGCVMDAWMRDVHTDVQRVVEAAGAGAMLKDYGRILGTPEAAAFSARVRDVHEWLATRLDRLPEPAGERPRVAVQDPCHLRHVQRSQDAVRAVLAPYAELAELDDEGLCCGAGGAYAATQPDLAAAIRERKLAAIDRSGARLVASANPGCALHLRAAGVETIHPCQVVAQALPA